MWHRLSELNGKNLVYLEFVHGWKLKIQSHTFTFVLVLAHIVALCEGKGILIGEKNI